MGREFLDSCIQVRCSRAEGFSMLAVLVLSVFTTISSPLSASAQPEVELKRGAFFGAKVVAVPDEIREQLKLDEGMGAQIEAIIPGSTAEAAGFKAGDVLLTLDGAKIAGAVELVQSLAGRK